MLNIIKSNIKKTLLTFFRLKSKTDKKTAQNLEEKLKISLSLLTSLIFLSFKQILNNVN